MPFFGIMGMTYTAGFFLMIDEVDEEGFLDTIFLPTGFLRMASRLALDDRPMASRV